MCHSCILIVIWVLATVLLCAYHVARGAIAYRARFEFDRKQHQRAQQHEHPRQPSSIDLYPQPWQRIFVVHVHDVLLHTRATIFGSLCLFGAANIAFSTASLTALRPESAILMVFLGLLGIAGISGQLAVILAKGQIPFPSAKD